jgi:hypothetical protein
MHWRLVRGALRTNRLDLRHCELSTRTRGVVLLSVERAGGSRVPGVRRWHGVRILRRLRGAGPHAPASGVRRSGLGAAVVGRDAWIVRSALGCGTPRNRPDVPSPVVAVLETLGLLAPRHRQQESSVLALVLGDRDGRVGAVPVQVGTRPRTEFVGQAGVRRETVAPLLRVTGVAFSFARRSGGETPVENGSSTCEVLSWRIARTWTRHAAPRRPAHSEPESEDLSNVVLGSVPIAQCVPGRNRSSSAASQRDQLAVMALRSRSPRELGRCVDRTGAPARLPLHVPRTRRVTPVDARARGKV